MAKESIKKDLKEKNSRGEKLLDFKKILAIMEKNFIVMTRDKIRLIPLMTFPIVMILVLGFTSGNTPKHISAAIISYDNSELSLSIQQEVANSQIFSVRHIVSTEDEGRKLLDEGKVLVLIEIPSHLEENVNSNIQTGIIVIVDESDSAVAATSKQGMNTIINKVASKISLEKMHYYQKSIDDAGMNINSYINMQTDLYGAISEKSSLAQIQIDSSKKILDSYTNTLKSTLPAPVPLAVDLNTITINNGTTFIQTNDTVVLREPRGTDQIKSQINLLQDSSKFLSAAQKNVNAASMLAIKSSKQSQKIRQEMYQKQILDSLSAIRVFTHSKSEVILRPLVYEDKPAYGNGKRAIDFLIPSLIALTIFQGAVMGMGRSVAGEKREGSLTRVFLTPTSNTTIIFGTLSFYVLFEICRAAFLIIISIVLFNIHVEGSLFLIALVLAIYISISISIGMMISSMVHTEQQYMAMAMLVSMPTMFLAGAFFPVQAMPLFMQRIASFLPATYAADALRGIMVKGFSIGMILFPLAILIVFLLLSIGGVLMVFKRDIE